jgi:two-component system response regulator FixJ
MINIVDEDVAVADVMAALLHTHGFPFRKYNSAEEFLPTLSSQSPSISFVSFGLFRHGANDILEVIRQGRTQSTVIMTSDGVETSRVVEAIKAGADDVIEKPFACEDLLAVIRRVLSHPMQCASSRQELPTMIASQLTVEEQRILSLMEQGATIKQIAAKLDISIRTVHYRKASVLDKTNCKNCTEVIAKLSAMRSTGNVPRSQFNLVNTDVLIQTA